MVKLLTLMLFALWSFGSPAVELLFDASRNRQVPVTLYWLAARDCSPHQPCPVALLSSGYGVAHDRYGFIAVSLQQAGYLVVAIQHELPGYPPLATNGKLFERRQENWQRGALTLAFVRATLADRYPGYDFNRLTLIGHSNGGDISAWLAASNAPYISRLITLDHRRVPLPRNPAITMLSLRASDFAPDAGVLPAANEQPGLRLCVVPLRHARHNDMTDAGPRWLQAAIATRLSGHLAGVDCALLRGV